MVLGLLGCVCATSTAAAAVSPKDAAATRGYLLAMLKQRHEGSGSTTTGVEAIDGLVSKLSAECPGILAGTPLAGPENSWKGPSKKPSSELHEEIGDAAIGAAERLDHTSALHFYERVKRLRWSDRRFTKMLHDLALESVRQTGIPAPDLCGDIRFWAAHAYSAVSPGTAREQRERSWASTTAMIEVEPGEPGLGLDPEAIVEHRLRRYENGPDRKLAKLAFPLAHTHLPPKAVAALEAYLQAFFQAVEWVYTTLGASVHS